MTALSRADPVRFRLPSFQRKLAHAEEVVAQALAAVRHPYVAWSTGKDSAVVLALALRQRPDIPVVWCDDELEFPQTVALVEQLRAGLNLTIVQGFARHAEWFDPWRSPPNWREPLPGTRTIGERVEPWSLKAGYDGCILGLRRQESSKRAMHLRRGRLVAYVHAGWRCNPIAGWSVDDVWAAIAGLGLPYNPAYDVMARIGVPRREQRVGPLPLCPGSTLRAGWPDTYNRLVERYGPRWGG